MYSFSECGREPNSVFVTRFCRVHFNVIFKSKKIPDQVHNGIRERGAGLKT